jgi:hypothetical protein
MSKLRILLPKCGSNESAFFGDHRSFLGSRLARPDRPYQLAQLDRHTFIYVIIIIRFRFPLRIALLFFLFFADGGPYNSAEFRRLAAPTPRTNDVGRVIIFIDDDSLHKYHMDATNLVRACYADTRLETRQIRV